MLNEDVEDNNSNTGSETEPLLLLPGAGAAAADEWTRGRILGWGLFGFIVSLPTMCQAILGRENIPLDQFKSAHEFFHSLTHDTGADAWIAGASSIGLNTPLSAMTMSVALPTAGRILATLLSTIGFGLSYCARGTRHAGLNQWFLRQKQHYRPKEHPNMAYLAAVLAAPAAMTFAQIAKDTFSFSAPLGWFGFGSNLVAYYAARTFPLIYMLRLLVSPTLRRQTWLSWVLPILDANYKVLLAKADGHYTEDSIMNVLQASNVNRYKLAAYTVSFILSVLGALWIGLAVSPAFAKEFMGALKTLKWWQSADSDNYQSPKIAAGYAASSFPSFMLYTSFSFNVLFRLIPAVMLGTFQVVRNREAMVWSAGLALLVGVTAFMAYQSGYGMKDVGYTALKDGVLDYLGAIKQALPESMFAGAGLVNWAPVMGMVWAKLSTLASPAAKNSELRKLHVATSSRETMPGLRTTMEAALPVHLSSVAGLFSRAKSGETLLQLPAVGQSSNSLCGRLRRALCCSN